MFIDIGHYVRDLNAYKALVEKINNLSVGTPIYCFKQYLRQKTWINKFNVD